MHPRRPARPSAAFLALSVVVSATAVSADDLGDVLELVPDEAVAWAVVPSLSKLNADLSDLIDRANRPELAVAGRPVDVMVSQFGMAAGFDERGALAIWSPSIDDLMVGAGAVAVPVESAERFLDANFDPEPSGGEGAYRRSDGTLVFARVVENHVLLAPRRDLVDDWKAGTAGVSRLTTPFGDAALQDMRRSDALLRISGSAMDEMERLADSRDAAGEVPAEFADAIPFDPTMFADRFGEVADGAEDIVVGVDADALAIGFRGWTRYAEDSPAAKSAATAGPGSPPLALLPTGPYYFAMGVDFAGLGGEMAARTIRQIAGDDFGDLSGFIELSEVVDGFAFSMRPSKLGIAMGGILNDAGVVVRTDDPERVAGAVGRAVQALDGIDGAIEREASFERGVKQRNGEIADQITVKAEIAPEERREAGSRVGDASIELTATRMTFGPRGWLGLGRAAGPGYVVTFSRRPDVFGSYRDAAGLQNDPVITAMESWMPANPSVQAFIDVGRLAGLARQVAGLVPGAEGMVPELDDTMPPIGFGLGLEGSDGGHALLEWGIVVPSEVVGTAVGLGMDRMLDLPGGGDR
ncbi:MAG: hypothetical protein CMJ34_01535 [Phycisphaerae bacterium]|nr:hypothetical protein [Phycisphaerae bacterium]